MMGSLLVWSASKADLASPTDPQSYLKKHLINVVLALILGFIVSRLDHRWLRAYTPVIYVLSVFSLFLPFVPGLGTKIAGARAWVQLPGGFTIQPSEFMKLAFIVYLASWMAARIRG